MRGVFKKLSPCLQIKDGMGTHKQVMPELDGLLPVCSFFSSRQILYCLLIGVDAVGQSPGRGSTVHAPGHSLLKTETQ